jgi:hypothetical protein
MKSPLLTASNGFYCVQNSQIINAGAAHLKEANKVAGLDLLRPADGQANPDRQIKDTLLRNQLVVVSSGALKGLKGTITFANETHAEVHILSRN